MKHTSCEADANPELIKALENTANELQRLRDVLLPHYEGKIGEPDIFVLDEAVTALTRAKGKKFTPNWLDKPVDLGTDLA